MLKKQNNTSKIYSDILFDLDGTIINSYEGITNGIKHVIRTLNIKNFDDDSFKKFIGPPIEKSFIKYFEGIDESNIEHTVGIYRDYYKETGIYECYLYPNIIECLTILKDNNKKIYLATAKPKIFATIILSHFNIDSFFEKIYGVEFTGPIKNKYDVISHAIKDSNLDTNSSIMIGDREDDVIASKKLGLDVLSVRYGFGEEIEFSSSEYIADHVLDILDATL